MLCFRQLAATLKKTTPTVAGRDPLRSSQSRTEGSQAGDKTKTPSGKGNTAARNAPTSAKNIIYIDEDDEVLDSQRGTALWPRAALDAATAHGLSSDPLICPPEASTSVKTDDLQDYVGRIFSSRHDLYRLGLHMTYTTSICGNMENGTVCCSFESLLSTLAYVGCDHQEPTPFFCLILPRHRSTSDSCTHALTIRTRTRSRGPYSRCVHGGGSWFTFSLLTTVAPPSRSMC